MQFEWSDKKAVSNLKKHWVSFHEATTVFGDYFSITIPDPLHSHSEDRFIILGMSNKERLLVVGHTDRGDKKRLISARKATKAEREQYEKR